MRPSTMPSGLNSPASCSVLALRRRFLSRSARAMEITWSRKARAALGTRARRCLSIWKKFPPAADSRNCPRVSRCSTCLGPKSGFPRLCRAIGFGYLSQEGDLVLALPRAGVTRASAASSHTMAIFPSAYATPVGHDLSRGDEIDISRGDMIVGTATQRLLWPGVFVPRHPVWMNAKPLEPGRSYFIKHTSHQVRGVIRSIHHRLDVNTLAHMEASRLRTERNRRDLGRDAPAVSASIPIRRTGPRAHSS